MPSWISKQFQKALELQDWNRWKKHFAKVNENPTNAISKNGSWCAPPKRSNPNFVWSWILNHFGLWLRCSPLCKIPILCLSCPSRKVLRPVPGAVAPCSCVQHVIWRWMTRSVEKKGEAEKRLLLLLLFPDDDEEFKWQQTHERVQKPAPHFQDLNSKKPSQHPLFRPVSCKTSREVNQGGQFTTTSLFLFWKFMKSSLQLSMPFFPSFHPLPWDGPRPGNSSKWRFRSGCCTKM